MLEDNNNTDPYYARGWVEILHRLDGQPTPETVMDLTADQYIQVGSNLPLGEYYSPIDIYQQFKDDLDPVFRIPRGFRAFDAVNMCSDEINRIVTLILIPRTEDHKLVWAGSHVQQLPELPLMMITRPKIFESFYLNNA